MAPHQNGHKELLQRIKRLNHQHKSAEQYAKYIMCNVKANPKETVEAGTFQSISQNAGEQSSEPDYTRKPLVEKKRRARINESLQELRLLLADSEAKLENAEVLELTVRRVQAVLERRSLEGGRLQREASERFAAGYIQCMHEVHTFVSGCPGIDATTAAELLNHLLESMPLDEGAFPDLMADVLADPWPGGGGGGGEALAAAAASLALPASAPSPSPSEETCSDSEEGEPEPGQTSTEGLDASRTRSLPSPSLPKSMWRPW
ncbi:PREDICTED: transcription cofactor HES-6-like [Calidris pugnax]|uniref:transcription cofactor HES-6-like n=1 Tax=Calidris pugnax TaxID=198806 RepID=UPI00071E20F9|nr:PREDICTED: transcription cofactor HES-6-like [Calidris pugnax]